MADKKDKTEGPSPEQLMPSGMDELNRQVPVTADNFKKMNATFENNLKGVNNLGKSFDTLGEKILSAVGGNDRRDRNQNAGSQSGSNPFQRDTKRSDSPPQQQAAQSRLSANQARTEYKTDQIPRTQQAPAPHQRTFATPQERYSTARGTTGKPLQPHLGGAVGQKLGGDMSKNLLQMGHMMSPMSFMQYSLMFGAGFPLQMKMAETITKPVTDVAEKYETGRAFAGGFTGIGDATKGFSQQLTQSPFDMYESMYQSKILLTSALGGERQSNKAIDTALNMAREYPVKTEQVLSSLSRLAVYPQTKPYLKNEDFQKKLMESVSGLSLIVPEQGMEGAMFSLIEAMSGSWRSLQMRFNVSPEVVESLSGMSKGEMSSDPNKLIEGLHRFIGKSVGLDVLEKQKYTFSKQVDNFGDSLQMMTRNVFEQTGLYKTITSGATAFQTGFSSLAENKTFLNFIGKMTQPFQERTDNAMAKFAGIPAGLYKQSPLSQVTKIMEENFEGMSYEEIGDKFSVLIDDMGGIWRDTNQGINTIINSAFGKTLGDIGGDIGAVVGSNFQGMAMAVMKGFGTTMLENPMDIVGTIATMALPVMGILGGAQLGIGLMQNFFSGETLGRRFMKLTDKAFGTHKFRTASNMVGDLSGNVDGMAIKSNMNDPKLNNLLYSKIDGESYDGKFKNKDTQSVLTRIADISDENRKILSDAIDPTINATHSKMKSRTTGLFEHDAIGGRTPIPLKSNQVKRFNAAIDRFTVSALGFTDPSDINTRYKSLDEVPMASFKRTELWRGMTKEGSELGNMLSLGDKGSDARVRKFIETEVYDQARTHAQVSYAAGFDSDIPQYMNGKGQAYDQRIANNEFSQVIADIRKPSNAKSATEAILGNVKEVNIDAKQIDLLGDVIGDKAGVRSGGISPPTMNAEIGAYITKQKKLGKLTLGEQGDIRIAAMEYNDAVNKGDYVVGSKSYNAISNSKFDYGNMAESLKGLEKSTGIRKLADNLNKFDFDPKSFAHMMGMMGDDKYGSIFSSIKVGNGTISSELTNNKSINQFITDKPAQLNKISQLDGPARTQAIDDVIRGGKAFGNVLNDNNIGKVLLGKSGNKRWQAIHTMAKIKNLKLFQEIRQSGLVKAAAPALAGALAFADVPLIGYQVGTIAKNMGLDKEGAARWRNGAALVSGGSVLAGGAILGAVRGARGVGAVLKEGVPAILGLGSKESLGKGFLSRGLGSVVGLMGMTGLYSALDAATGYSESVQKIGSRRKAYSSNLLNYDLNSKEYSSFMKKGGATGNDDFTGAFTNKGRASLGIDKVGKDWMKIAGVGIISGLVLGLTGGTGALPLALGAAALGSGGSALGSFLSGSGDQTEKERYTAGAITGFLGNRKFQTDKSRGMGKEIGYLQAKQKSTGLTFAESVKLRNLDVGKAKIDLLSAATLEGAKEVTNISNGSQQFRDDRQNGADIDRFGRIRNVQYDSYTDEEKNILGYGQSLATRKNRSTENKIGGYLATQSYIMDQYNPKVKKVFEEGSNKEIITKAMSYAKVLDSAGEQYDTAMGSINLKDGNQVEIMKQARLAMIRNIQLPLGNVEAMSTVRDSVAPRLLKDFYKNDAMSVVTLDKTAQNSYAEVSVAAQNKLAQLGLGDPNDILTKDQKHQNDDTPTKFGKVFDDSTIITQKKTMGWRDSWKRNAAGAVARDTILAGVDSTINGGMGTPQKKELMNVLKRNNINPDNIGTNELNTILTMSRKQFRADVPFNTAVSDRMYDRFQAGAREYKKSGYAEKVDTLQAKYNLGGENPNEKFRFIEKMTGRDIINDPIAAGNADFFSTFDIDNQATRSAYKNEFGNLDGYSELSKAMGTGGTYQGSNISQKREYFQKTRVDALETSLEVFSGKEFEQALIPFKRNFDILQGLDFNNMGFSEAKGSELEIHKERVNNAYAQKFKKEEELTGFVNEQVKAGNLEKGEIDTSDGFNRAELERITQLAGSSKFIAGLAKSSDTFDKSMLVLTNSTNVTSEAVDGKLSQSLEKTSKLFQMVATAGNALSRDDFRNRLTEQTLASGNAITELKTSGIVKRKSAEKKFEELREQGVDFKAISESVNMPINSMADLMINDKNGRSILSKIGNLDRSVDSEGNSANKYGLTEKTFKLFNSAGEDYTGSQVDMVDASQKSFNHASQMGQASGALTVGGSPFYSMATKVANMHQPAKQKMVNTTANELIHFTKKIDGAKNRKEKIFYTNAAAKSLQTFEQQNGSLSYLQLKLGKQIGAKRAESMINDVAMSLANEATNKSKEHLASIDDAAKQFTTQEAAVATGGVQGDNTIPGVEKVSVAAYDEGMIKAAKAKDTLEGKKEALGIPKETVKALVNKETGVNTYLDKDNKVVGTSDKAKGKADVGVKITNGAEIGQQIAAAMVAAFGSITKGNGGSGGGGENTSDKSTDVADKIKKAVATKDAVPVSSDKTSDVVDAKEAIPVEQLVNEVINGKNTAQKDTKKDAQTTQKNTDTAKVDPDTGKPIKWFGTNVSGKENDLWSTLDIPKNEDGSVDYSSMAANQMYTGVDGSDISVKNKDNTISAGDGSWNNLFEGDGKLGMKVTDEVDPDTGKNTKWFGTNVSGKENDLWSTLDIPKNENGSIDYSKVPQSSQYTGVDGDIITMTNEQDVDANGNNIGNPYLSFSNAYTLSDNLNIPTLGSAPNVQQIKQATVATAVTPTIPVSENPVLGRDNIQVDEPPFDQTTNPSGVNDGVSELNQGQRDSQFAEVHGTFTPVNPLVTDNYPIKDGLL